MKGDTVTVTVRLITLWWWPISNAGAEIGEYVFRSQKWWTFFRSQIFFSQSKFFFAVKTFFRSQSLFSQSEFIFAVKFDSDKGKNWLRKNDEELPIKIRSQKLSFFRSHPVHHSKIINVITNQDNTELYNRLKIELEYLRNC